MSSSSRERWSGETSLIAAASAAVIVAGLVAVPPEPQNPVVNRVEVAAVQLQSVVTTDIGVILGNARTSATTTSKPIGAAVAAVNPALLLITVPLWFLAFPITIPLSVVFWTSFALQNPNFAGNPLAAIVYGIQAGLSNWFSAPLPLVFAFGGAASVPRTAAAIRARATASQSPTASASSITTGVTKRISRGAPKRNGGIPSAARTAAAPAKATKAVAPAKATKAVAAVGRNDRAIAGGAASQAHRRAARS